MHDKQVEIGGVVEEVTNESIFAYPDGTKVQIAALISRVQIKQTRESGGMAIVTIESAKESIEAIIFPSTYCQSGSKLEKGRVVTFKGRIDDGRPDSAFKILVDDGGIQ